MIARYGRVLRYGWVSYVLLPGAVCSVAGVTCSPEICWRPSSRDGGRPDQ